MKTSAMGNVHASAPKLEPDLPPSPPMGLNLPTLQPEPSPSEPLNSKNGTNPGTIEELHKKCKGKFRHEVEIVNFYLQD